MNRIEEAKDLIKINKKLEARASDESIGYSPGDIDLSPSKYFCEGYLRAQQDLICHLVDKNILSIKDAKQIWE